MDFRFSVAFIFFILLYGGLVGHFYKLQIKHEISSSAKASTLKVDANLVRGNIYFSNKDDSSIPAALNKDYPMIVADPEMILREGIDIKEAAAKLSAILGVDEEIIASKISKPKDQYEELAKDVSPEVVKAVEELSLSGVRKQSSWRRFYPFGQLSSQVLGFVSKDGEGKYGIESLFNKDLSGVESADQKGSDVYLTIDPLISAEAEKILNNLIHKYKAKSGQVIVMNPKTGDILALAGNPSFDPNNYGKAEMSSFLNKPIQSVYEPGSVFKIVTVAAALDSNSITPETTYVDSGSLTLNNRTVKNWDGKAHGKLTMAEVIEKSINTGTAFMATKMGEEVFLDYIKKFGFEEKLDVDLPGEVVGDISNLEKDKAPINFATASYGHGVTVTPLRMLTAINAIANKGVIMKPRILKNEPVKKIANPVSPETAKTVTNIMVSAVDKAKVAKIANFSVAGKTGTALVPKNGRYTEDVINTYVGFAPATDPQFSILIRMDEPLGAPLAGTTIVPAFRELAEFLLVYYNILPDRIENNS